MARKAPLVAALDIETTPGRYGFRPLPLCVVIVCPEEHWTFRYWGLDCIEKAHQFLVSKKRKGRLLAHNGGKFDFGYYTHDEGKKRVIGSRLLTSSIGGWETFDTLLLMPTALKNLGNGTEEKGEMRLDWHHIDATEEQQEYILKYCEQDCHVLLNAYKRFCKVFTGDENKPCKDTAASNAFKALKGYYPDLPASAWQTTKAYDDRIRKYYHGGIVNTFGPARDISGRFTMVDANSMYPGAMKNFQHPCSNRAIDVANPTLIKGGKLRGFGDRVFFIEFQGWSNILPHVKPTGGLEYNVTGTYNVTSHELQAAMRHGMVRIDKITAAIVFQDTTEFSLFVDDFYGQRKAAQAAQDAAEYCFKIVLNSAYGKYGMDPGNYSDTMFCAPGCPPDDDQPEVYTPWKFKGWTSDDVNQIWEREKILQDEDRAFINVGTAASITGAARATLIDAIGAVLAAGGVVHYTDTDSITFEGPATMTLGKELGQWKIEAELDRLVIAGPKLYAMHTPDAKPGKAWKIASKGVRASANEIIDLVAGVADIVHCPEMGSFDVSGTYRTTRRTIKRDSLVREKPHGAIAKVH